MATHVPDEELLLALLNSTPVIDGHPEDRLADPAGSASYLRSAGAEIDMDLDTDEHAVLLRARELLQSVVDGAHAPAVLAPLLTGVGSTPHVTGEGIAWSLTTPDGTRTAVRAVLAWDRLARDLPGRLRPCANSDCRLYFVDRSRPGTGRWCSMAVCGNRMKARRHHIRTSGSRTDG
ncbi:putative RNA-binding Zn ribbon-like protein [Pseudonocardia sediminis]|uniref:Putative RNA-binding Zn ribbon-like protein n=1 Tax=Pseudonocardia sediminis TaxID=1397368 RepID=A0A4Q7V2S1_PSEST|nr:CGNR zinc finger domain-containing protein [Pseudonocardia sediminis]RZT87818.1 putative RNA-binding Zn ribbon-like protein [Pseudonocardia sediminis]